MNMSQRYAEAEMPNPVRVLGVELLPVTLGHAKLLQRVGSQFAPFVALDPDAEIGMGDIFEAIYILSRPAAKAAADLRSWSFWITLNWWAAKYCFAITLRPWKHLAAPTAAAAIARHVRACCTGPSVFPKRSDSPGLQAPYLAILEVVLRSRLHVQDPDNVSVRRAQWMTSVFCEMEGSVEFRGDGIPDRIPPASERVTVPVEHRS